MSKDLSCPACKAELPRGAEQCPACGAKAPEAEGTDRAGRRHREHGRSAHASRRYVYGRRKEGLSAEVMWLLLVVVLGLLLILGVHLLAYMRARKLVEAPGPPPTAVVRICDLAEQMPQPLVYHAGPAAHGMRSRFSQPRRDGAGAGRRAAGPTAIRYLSARHT